jgi:hypothetical protein
VTKEALWVEPSNQRQRILVGIDVDAERDVATRLDEANAHTDIRHRGQPGRRWDSNSTRRFQLPREFAEIAAHRDNRRAHVVHRVAEHIVASVLHSSKMAVPGPSWT